MSHLSKRKRDAIRLTIDIPADQHTYIKMLAVSEGISLKDFVISYLPSPEEPMKTKNIPKGKFNKLLNEFIQEKSAMLTRLSKK